MIFFEENTEFVPVLDGNTITDETGHVYDLTRTVSDAAIAFIMLGIIMGLTLSIFLLLRFTRKNGGHILSVLTGVMTYFLFSIGIYGIISSILNSIPTMKQFTLDHPIQKTMIVSVILAILLVAGKMAGAKLVSTKYDTNGDILAMSTGFAFCDVIYSLIYWIILLTIMLAFNNNGGIIGVFTDQDAVGLLEIAKSYEGMFDLPKEAWMYQSLHIILMLEFNTYSIIPLYGVIKKVLSPYYVAIVVGINYVILVLNSFATYEKLPYLAVFFIEFIIVFASLRFFGMLSKEKLGDMLKAVPKVNVKKKQQKFPKFK